MCGLHVGVLNLKRGFHRFIRRWHTAVEHRYVLSHVVTMIDISSATRQRRIVPRELLQHVQSCVVCADRECVERRHLEVLIGIRI
jgi:hypothetical protein